MAAGRSLASTLRSVEAGAKSVYVLHAGCCCYQGFYVDYPACIGCETGQTVLCFDCNSRGCKDLNSKGPKYVTLQASDNTINYPTKCIKCASQCFIFYNACALPCDNDVPAIVAFCCVVCYPTFGIMKKVGELPHKKITIGVGAPPRPEFVDRD
ncbi:hypothetical protein M885DRAFT_519437 [Pelagophyceae sp. CCMP2097]|nr:hypothetical protein M885DRAFT_519437 [Pelagophyceae sp. CCMP2097]|mmetsp:Transcript_10857/g.36223  ORF Transcript_10857/g.36223 Transcript_10857/m.36223 type:complete len:154 (+) Transcript_10857:156-617(+)